ncbi:patatin-like phospholipase family protein [Stigmatella sp. ncwal1]|uniref:Patatin-like phospholipase family protein n=1 Tax=Stigmatella ashevillensis TaxID=2995309 RepID=A0ABT5DFI1_9BACT|nr:patatin-like phospholipase family protein [Stigmatella ashevillena]MDC0711883.1 patatin-like phospholipase family protein [Stigmatella ashevillena]
MLPALALTLLVAAVPEPSEASAPRSEHPLAFVLSGGVSLGSYEAGLAWASVRFPQVASARGLVGGRRRVPRLTAVTGASAGSINALLSALIWCESPETTADASVDSNLLRDLWLPVGLERLLPEDPTVYSAGDAILSTLPLTEALAALERKLLAPDGSRRFQPGCRLPVGLTVTRATPETRLIAGLPTLTQKFVLPWVLEVTREGQPRLRRQPLTTGRDAGDNVLRLPELAGLPAEEAHFGWSQGWQALLASGAFPLAFAPRPLCDCAVECPSDQRVEANACQGPGQMLPPMSCAAQSSPGTPLTLCRRRYVDGGIFDNAPVGLAIDLTESTYTPALLQPTRYLFVDPDLRRLLPYREPLEHKTAEGSGLSAGVQLLGSLVSTGRNVDLARAVRAGRWNRTTQGLLRETAASLLPFIFIHLQLHALREGTAIASMEPPSAFPDITQHGRFGRLLAECFDEGAADVPAHWHACAQRFIALSQDVAPSRDDTPPLSSEKVVWLAERVTAQTSHTGGPGLWASTPKGVLPPPYIWEQEFIDRLICGTAALYFLADEVDALANSALSPERLLQTKAALLGVVQIGRTLASATNAAANTLLLRDLERLEADAALSPVATQARRAVAALEPGALFSPADLQPLLTALAPGALGPQATPEPDGVVRLRHLVHLHPHLQRVSAQAEALSREARELLEHRGGERALLLSSRFSPLASSHLFNFAGFLDRPLREFDYYAGVYDAAQSASLAMCSMPEVAPSPPMRQLGVPHVLDLREPGTQRCLGYALRHVVETLDLSSSPKARYVVGRLARLELAAALDDRQMAAKLEDEPSWAWLKDFAAATPEPTLVAVADALLSRMAPCAENSQEPLCVKDLTFEAFIAALREHGYVAQSPHMLQAMEDVNGWAMRTMRQVLDRSHAIERQETAQSPVIRNAVLLAHSAGQLWLRRAEDVTPTTTYPRFVWDLSTIPTSNANGRSSGLRAAAHLLPYRMSFDVAHGGISLAWMEPALHLSSRVSLMSTVEPLDIQSEHDRLSSTVGLRPALRLGDVTVSTGPRISFPWVNGNGVDVGGEVRVGGLQDRVGLSLGVRRMFARREEGPGWFVALSVSDINGLAYWLML